MGTTESILYDDGVGPMETPSVRPRAREAESSSLPSSNKIRPHHTINGDATLGMKQQPRAPSRRRPPTQVKPIKRMEGLVLGGPKTGKRTLLSRLKGTDPFAAKEQNKSINSNSTKEEEEVNPSIIIQYKPPSESPTWDRIKLRIQYRNSIDDGKKIVKNENTTTQINFVVLLISPKNSRETTQSYLEGILAMYLDRLGYPKAVGGDNGNDESERETDSKGHSTDVIEPFCIAILFNFRDLEAGQEEEDPATFRADLKRLVNDALRSRNVPESKAVVELFETSLLNCYGLDGLHKFIYRTYLQRSQTDIERQLNAVRNQILLTDNKSHHQADDKNSEAKAMTYDKFLNEIAPKEEVQSSEHQPEHSTDSHTEDHEQVETVSRRINMRQNGGGQTSTLRMGKDALEAFLASSSDDDDAKPPASHRIRSPNAAVNGISSDSDDDSDDDFFYDESGNRRHHSNNQNPKIRASRGVDRNEALDDSSDDSSSSEEDNEDGVREVPSSPKVLSENPNQMHRQDKKSQTSQQIAMVEEHTSDEEKTETGERIEHMKKETTRQEGEAAEASAVEMEEELIDEEDTNEAHLATNEREKRCKSDEEVSKDGSVNDNGIKRDDGAEDKAMVVDNETYDVGITNIINNDDTDACEGSNGEANGEVGYQNSNTDYANDDNSNNISVTNSDVADVVNKENDDENHITATLPLNTEYNDDDGHEIGSTPAIGKVVEVDNNKDGDVYMIGSNAVGIKVALDDNYDDDDMINSTSTVGNDVDDNDNYNDDGDGDGHMINSTPAIESFLESNEDNDHGFMISSASVIEKVAQDDNNDDDDDDYMINSIPAVGKAVEDNDDDNDDGYMFDSTAVVKNSAQNHSDDDDDDYMIDSTPAIETVVEDNDSDDDDGFMITSTAAVKNTAQDNDNHDDNDYMIGSVSVVEKVTKDDGDSNNEFMRGNVPAKDDRMKEDDSDSDFMIQSHPIEDGNKNTEDFPKTRLSKSHSSKGPSSGSAVDAKGKKSKEVSEPPSATNSPQSSKPVASGGISQAALAAIAAAQQEAEAMAREQQQQRYSQIPPAMIKEKKSKKKKKGEKKKKKKSKGLDD